MVIVDVELSGGAELLFGGARKIPVVMPDDSSISDLIIWLKDNKLELRQDLFVSGNSVRPGILVLINDVDWEIEGTKNYKLKNNDTITFISTLHGG